MWQEPHGDKRNDIVFIGYNMNKNKMIEKLNSCLININDFKKGPSHWNTLYNKIGKNFSS